jgi:flagellar export protein FliJ
VTSARTGRLDRLIGLREREESLVRQALGNAVRVEEVARIATECGVRALERAQQQWRDAVAAGALSPERLRALGDEALSREHALDRLRAAQADAARAREAAQAEYELARRKRKVLERLEERRAAVAALDARRAEQRDLDEVALRLHRDAAACLPSGADDDETGS